MSQRETGFWDIFDMTSIRFEDVTKAFGPTVVVEKLDLAIREGEFFTFVGPSGCGKSTVLHMIAGLESPTRGRILFDDRPVDLLSPRERDVALVFQNYALYPHMTVFENIGFPLKMKKQPRSVIGQEVHRVAQLLGIADFLAKKPKELSGGQRQRVALGRAIVRRPRVFLMDEPLSNLDARLRIEMRAELKLLHQKLGITTVYVTHDQSEAMGLSDRVAVLNKGRVQQCDAPQAVYGLPANTFVAAFIGIPSMNILPATVVSEHPFEIAFGGIRLKLRRESPTQKKAVFLGIRPEDLIPERSGTEKSIEMTVSVVEPAGAVTWVELARGELKLRTVARPDLGLRPRERCYLALPVNKICLFDADSGERL